MRAAIEHVLSHPVMSIASQGGSIDWFRFRLQGCESPLHAMPGECRRWEKLCNRKDEENSDCPTRCVRTRGGPLPSGR